jgi:predicted nucleic acid-binding protein
VADGRHVWERRKGEPPQAFHAFVHYRDLGLERSLDKAWRVHQGICRKALAGSKAATSEAPGSWGRWCRQYGWRSRCEAFDEHMDRQAAKAYEAKILKRREEHAEQLALVRSALVLPAATVAELLAKRDPQFLTQLRTMSAEDLLHILAKSSSALPSIVTAERLVLGEATERLAEQTAEVDHGIPDALRSDKDAARLANEFAARLANAGAHFADRVGD